MTFRSLLPVLLCFATSYPLTAGADANDGEFMGYRLNQRYPVTATTEKGRSAGGNTQVVAENPVMPADIESVRINCTVSTCTIGFIEAITHFETEQAARDFATKYYQLLRAKYPDWIVQTGQMGFNDDLRPVALSIDKPPHRLRLRLYDLPPGSDSKFRIGIGLSYLPDSREQVSWTDMALSERSARYESTEEKLLERSDTRGL